MTKVNIIDRGDIIKKNLSIGLIAKVLGMGLSYVSLPIILNYLGERNYGVWITIFSILSWIYNFDVGIGNGLKNKLTEALTKKDTKLAKEYISTAYVIIIFITIILLLLGVVGIHLFNFTSSLNVNFLNESYLKMVIFISFIFTLSNFVIGLYKQLFYSVHESALVGVGGIFYQLIIIVLILLLRNYFDSSLLMLAFVYGISNLIVGIIFSIEFFKKRMELLPNIRFFSKKKVRDIAGLGIEFFIIQLCMIVIFTTDNLIITKFLGPEAVTSYNIISKIYRIFLIIVSIILAPFWALFTDAYIKKDKKWILNTLKKLNLLFVLLIVIELLFTINLDFFIKLWLGKLIVYPSNLPWYMMVSSFIMCFGGIYMYCLNGFGKIKLQLYIYVVGAIINIPLSICFINKLGFKSDGVILATNLSTICLALFLPIQVYKLTKKLK